MINIGIGKKLSEILEQKNSNPNELSELSGIPSSTIYSIIKRDNSKVDIQVLLKICNVLNIKADVFYQEYMSEEPNHFSEKKESPPDNMWESLKPELMQLPDSMIDDLHKYIKYLLWLAEQG